MDVNQKRFTNKGLFHRFQSKNHHEKIKNIPLECQELKDFVDLCYEVKYLDTKCQNKLNQFNLCLQKHQTTNQS